MSDAKPSGSVTWKILLSHSVSMFGIFLEMTVVDGTHCSIISSGNLSNGFARDSDEILPFEPELSILEAGESSMVVTRQEAH